MAHINDLPNEMLQRIFDYFCTDQDLAEWLSISLTQRRWRPFGQRGVHERVVITQDNYLKVLACYKPPPANDPLAADLSLFPRCLDLIHFSQTDMFLPKASPDNTRRPDISSSSWWCSPALYLFSRWCGRGIKSLTMVHVIFRDIKEFVFLVTLFSSLHHLRVAASMCISCTLDFSQVRVAPLPAELRTLDIQDIATDDIAVAFARWLSMDTHPLAISTLTWGWGFNQPSDAATRFFHRVGDALEKLDLYITYPDKMTLKDWKPDSLPDFSSNSGLRELFITAINSDSMPSVVPSILHALNAPLLEDLWVVFTLDDFCPDEFIWREVLDAWGAEAFEDVVCDEKKFPALERIVFHIEQMQQMPESNFLDARKELISKLPRLQKKRIEILVWYTGRCSASRKVDSKSEGHVLGPGWVESQYCPCEDCGPSRYDGSLVEELLDEGMSEEEISEEEILEEEMSGEDTLGEDI